MISMKKEWVKTDGWRGYYRPINAVAGSSDTGMFDDSPCPSDKVKAELDTICKELRKAEIAYRRGTLRSSNGFMGKRWVVVAPEDKDRAREIIMPMLGPMRYAHD